ncbi:hypothetical protein MHYP_G00123180 [Metynnis hypsauchen]
MHEPCGIPGPRAIHWRERQRFQGKPDDAMTSMQVNSRVEESSGVRSGSAGSGGKRRTETTAFKTGNFTETPTCGSAKASSAREVVPAVEVHWRLFGQSLSGPEREDRCCFSTSPQTARAKDLL